MHTAERVSARDASDNYVFQRSILAYHEAASIVSGNVLEIGTGMGYGIEVVAPAAARFITVDKSVPVLPTPLPDNAEFRRMSVPPIDFPDGSFDCVISFQVIEHIRRDEEFVREVSRVLRKGGVFVVSTPNAPMSLTRNPWHVREYTATQLTRLLRGSFSEVECRGVFGNDRVMEYYAANKLRLPYDILNRMNRRRLLADNRSLTSSISMSDYRVAPYDEGCFDLFCIARK